MGNPAWTGVAVAVSAEIRSNKRSSTLPADVIAKISAHDVVNRWRLRGAEAIALRAAARSCGGSESAAKEHLAAVGLCLAAVEVPTAMRCERSPVERLITRAIHHARKALADSAPMAARFVSLQHVANRVAPSRELSTLMQLAEQQHAPTSRSRAGELRELLRAATAPQERQLIRAFRDKGCSTLGDVERLYGWSRGQASVIASRLREKVLHKLAA